MTTRKPSETYSPLYFLASVGAGGLMVTFFMWLMFWIPHPGKTVPVFEDIMAAFAAGHVTTQAMIVAAMAGIAFFAFQNIHLLIWNLRRYAAWRKTDAFQAFAKTNAQSQILALPLALAMAVNGGFIIGLVFVPGLWAVVEYLFPLAMVAFFAIGVLALKQYGNVLGRVLTEGSFNCAANNNFGQILPAFAFAMVGVGLSAPAAMSTSAPLAGASIVVSTFFLMASALDRRRGHGPGPALDDGKRRQCRHRADAADPRAASDRSGHSDVAPGARFRRAFRHRGRRGRHAGTHLETAGHAACDPVVRRSDPGQAGLCRPASLSGPENSAGAYALICPGVALSVMLQFFVNNGLVKAGIVDKFGIAFWVITALAIAAQFAMAGLLLLLNRRHFGTRKDATAVPAE